MMRVMLYEAAQSMLRSKKWSWLKAWAMQIARRRGMKKAIVAARKPGGAAGAGVGVGVPELWLAESLPVLSSGAQSRRGRIITRMDTTDLIPITDHLPATECGTVTPGYPLAS
jgi:hypothetical protein